MKDAPLEQLFGSKTRTKLLKLFMSNPNRSFYVREITRKIEEQINSVRRELANLLSMGIITSDSTNNKLYYEVDQKHQHYAALHALFTGKKISSAAAKSAKKTASNTESESEIETVEVEQPANETPSAATVDSKVWEKAGNIAGLIYSGVFTRDGGAPVDVLIIGDVPVSRAEAAVAELEKQEGKELRYAVIELDEWQYRRQVNDKFWTQIVAAKNQIIIDSGNLFEEK